MNRDPLDNLIPPSKLGELFAPQRRRTCTLNVDARTHDIITAVSEQTGQSRPKVLAAFVETAYYHYVKEAEDAGVDPIRPATGNHKGARKRKKK